MQSSEVFESGSIIRLLSRAFLEDARQGRDKGMGVQVVSRVEFGGLAQMGERLPSETKENDKG
jgi:hypothetical protein